jgi:hypothetical protein
MLLSPSLKAIFLNCNRDPPWEGFQDKRNKATTRSTVFMMGKSSIVNYFGYSVYLIPETSEIRPVTGHPARSGDKSKKFGFALALAKNGLSQCSYKDMFIKLGYKPRGLLDISK